MRLANSYLNTTRNFDKIMNSILNAKAPERFTNKFLEDLGFKSSNDRLMIGVLKSIGLLDENSQPTQRYYDFLDQSQSKKVIRKGIEEAYEDLFNVRKDAQNMTNEEVKNKLKTLTQGQKSDRVIGCMAMTFKTLCDYADWTEDTVKDKFEDTETQQLVRNENNPVIHKNNVGKETKMNLHYNIQIHLPETTNMAVYDAIFQSLKQHLL